METSPFIFSTIFSDISFFKVSILQTFPHRSLVNLIIILQNLPFFNAFGSKEKYRMLLLAGRTIDDNGLPCVKARGDDIVLFISREDVYEE